MDVETVRALNALNRRFYRAFGQSFSDTRQAPWPGWGRVAEELRANGLAEPGRVVRVLDVGCGNCRFERFLLETFPQVRWQFCLLDSVPVGETPPESQFAAFDFVEALLTGDSLPFADADLTVAFGLMHHIPSEGLRAKALDALLAATRPGGLVAMSLWQFMSDEGLAAKARATTAASGINPAILEPGDCILGWQDAAPEDGALRYCHHFTDAEIDRLAAAAPPMARFRADGRTGALNTYLIFKSTAKGGA